MNCLNFEKTAAIIEQIRLYFLVPELQIKKLNKYIFSIVLVQHQLTQINLKDPTVSSFKRVSAYDGI